MARQLQPPWMVIGVDGRGMIALNGSSMGRNLLTAGLRLWYFWRIHGLYEPRSMFSVGALQVQCFSSSRLVAELECMDAAPFTHACYMTKEWCASFPHRVPRVVPPGGSAIALECRLLPGRGTDEPLSGDITRTRRCF